MKTNILILKMLLRDIFKNWWNLFWIFLVPIIFMIFIGFTNGYETTLSGMLFLPILTTCLLVVPILINKYRSKNWFYLMFGNKINSWRMTYLIPIVFFSILMVWITCLFLIFALIFFGYNQSGFVVRENFLANNTSSLVYQNSINILFTQKKDAISYIENYFYFGYAVILGISWSFLINVFVKNIKLILIINGILFLYNLFFIGLIIPFSIIQTNAVLYGFSFLAPFKYLASMNYVSMWSSTDEFLNVTGSRVFDFEFDFIIRNRNEVTQSYSTPNTIMLFSGIEKLMNFTIPFILISLCINFSSSKFRWFDKNTRVIAKNKNVEIANYSKSSWYIYGSINFLIIVSLCVGISMLIIANHIKTESYIINKANIDLNITYADYYLVTGDQYNPIYFNEVNALRILRINNQILEYATLHNIDLATNLNEFNLKYSIGMCLVTLMIIAESIWAGLFMKRMYYRIQSKIYQRYSLLELNI